MSREEIIDNFCRKMGYNQEIKENIVKNINILLNSGVTPREYELLYRDYYEFREDFYERTYIHKK